MDETTVTSETQEINNRRAFMGQAARFGLGLAGAVMIPAMAANAVTPPLTFKDIPKPGALNLPGGLKAGDDVHVLNYALALEDLESDLYIQALQRLTVGGTNKVGKTIPGLGIDSGQPDVSYITEYSAVEAEHRDFLRGSLDSLFSGLAIQPMKYDFGIETKSRAEVLDLVLDAEATGVRAYLGAIPFLKTRLFITAAAAIQGTEARHTAVLSIVKRELFGTGEYSDIAPLAGTNHGADTPLSPDAVLAHVSPFIVRS